MPKAAPPEIESPPFAPPTVEVGQIVLWTYGPGAAEVPCPAIVRKVGNNTLNLSLVVDSQKDFSIKGGVRHCDDPFLASMPGHDSGCWRKTPRDLRIDALLASFGHSEEE